MSLNDLPHPPDEGGSQGTRKESHEDDDTMITVPLTEAEWCDLFIDLGHGIQSRLPHLPRDIRIIKAFAHLRGLCSNSVAIDSLNSFQEKYYWQEANAATQRRKHSHSYPPGAIDTNAECLCDREASKEYLDVVRITEKLDRSIASLSIKPKTGLEPPTKTDEGKPIVNDQIFCHNKSVLFLDEHGSDSEETTKSRRSVSAAAPATTSSLEHSGLPQAEGIQMINKIDHRRSEPTSATRGITATSREVPNESLASKTLLLANPATPPPSSLYIDPANQSFSLSPNGSPGALRLESFSPILSTVKENCLVEDRWRDSQVYGGALDEYLAPLPRHSLIDGVGDAEGGVTAPSELSPPGRIPEVTLSSPPGQTIMFSSPSSTCTNSTRSGIPRSTATFGKHKELPLTPPAPITAKKLISNALKGKETSSFTSRAKGAKAEPPQPKPSLVKTLRASSGGDGTTSNISKLLAKKTYPALKNEAPSKGKPGDLGRFTSLRSTSAIPTPRVIDRSLLAKDGNDRKLPVEKILENAKPELGTKLKTVAPLVPTNPRSPNIAPTTKPLLNKLLTSPPVHQSKHAPGYIMDKRGTRTSISSSLLSSPKRRFNSAISIYEDMPLLREDSSSTLLSAASNSSENIATMAQAESEVLATAGFSKGSPKLVEVSKNPMEFGISLGSGNPRRMVRPPRRVFSRDSISTVPECGEEDALLLSPTKAMCEPTNLARRQSSLHSTGERLDEDHDKSRVLKAQDTKNSDPLPRPIVPQENGEYQPNTSQPLAPSIRIPPFNERTNMAVVSTDYSSPSHGKALSKTHQRTTSIGSNKTTKSTSTTTSTSTSGSSATVKATRSRYIRNGAIVPSKTISTKPPENPKAAIRNGSLPSTKNFLRRGSGTKTKPTLTPQANSNTTLTENIDPKLSGLDAKGTGSSHDIAQNPEARNKPKSTNECAHNKNNPPSGEWLRNLDHCEGNLVKNMGDSGAIIEQETLFTNSKPGNTIPTKCPEARVPRRVPQNHLVEGPLRRNDGNQTLSRVPPIENLSGKTLTPTKTRVLADLSAIGSNRNPRTLPSPGRSWFGRRSLVSVPTSATVSGKENYDPSNAQQGTTPVNKEKVKSRSLGNLAGWLHRSPKMSPDGLFSRGAKKDKDKLSKAASGLIVRPTPATLTLQPPGRHEQKAEFSHNDVENLIKRLSTQLPSTPDGLSGFNALGGKYYTSGYIPNLDESPSKESNPIAVCMDLINSASEEAQSPRRERLLQMSSIMVDAVSKSRDAECAAEEAKIAAAKAECAFLETRKSLQAMTELLKMRGKDVLCEILF